MGKNHERRPGTRPGLSQSEKQGSEEVGIFMELERNVVHSTISGLSLKAPVCFNCFDTHNMKRSK